MNPFSTINKGFRRGRNSVTNPGSNRINRLKARHTRSLQHKAAKLKDSYGCIGKKSKLKCCMLNVDGLSESSFNDVKAVLASKCPDVCILLETKRRLEDDAFSIEVTDYDVSEYRRSDLAGDKGGGGIAVFTRKSEGLVFKDFDPELPDPSQAFIRKERVWKTVESANQKTAICAVYAGFQAPDDRNGVWK